MKNKYIALENEYKKTVNLLANTAGWSADQAESVVTLVVQAAEKRANAVAVKNVQDLKNAKYLATKKLLQNYHRLRDAINLGTEHALKLLEDTEYQRLMDAEESLQNQRVQSVALIAAANRVLWIRVNTALECLKEISQGDDIAMRGYELLHQRYLSPREFTIEQILTTQHIVKSTYHQSIRDATDTLSVLLFGLGNAEDFIFSQKG